MRSATERTAEGVPTRVWMRQLIPMLHPYRTALGRALLAMVLDATLTVLRPWPLKAAIDLDLSHRHSRQPFLGGGLAAAPPRAPAVVFSARRGSPLPARGTRGPPH